ncbi:MAG TPA: ferrous iron transport protein B [Bacteroidales bacterium]|nr:ferrous iron transport protein B [Bacteroidales bacterium]
MHLNQLQPGEKAIITKVKGRGAFRKRIMEMGFVGGREVLMVQKAPMNDPIEYRIMGYNVSLRNSEARLIEVVTPGEAMLDAEEHYNGSSRNGSWLVSTAQRREKHIQVAFVGNPNSGKTTIFNYASGSHERVGNYGGVTVDAKEARFRLDGYTFDIVDLPGTYSITAYSPEELYVRRYIQEQMPDVVVNVVDAGNLERNLYLTTQLIDMDIKVVMALNMYDEMEKKGDRFDHTFLGKLLGIPIVPTIGSKRKGIEELFRKIIEVYEDKEPSLRHIHINYGKNIEQGIEAVQELLRHPHNHAITDKVSSRFLAIKLLEKDEGAMERMEEAGNREAILARTQREIRRIEEDLGEDTETLITDAKYGFIAGALKQTYTPSAVQRRRKTDIIDTFITHKLWGIPVFLFFMWMTFFVTFRLGSIPIEWIEAGVDWVSAVLEARMSGGWLKDLLIQGVIGGVGGVIIFMPNILLLYFFISLMEDSGYMARAVFIMDKAMHRIGLHGKSFIPLLMGFGCNVPAIMSTRIIESRRDRLITMLITPFMSCSARLPVFVLFISAFFVKYQASILFGLYTLGVLLAVVSALLFRRTMFRKADIPFVMELPPYRVPSGRTLLKHMWFRAEQYLRKIGGIILMASIIIWALGYFPRESEKTRELAVLADQLTVRADQALSSGDLATFESLGHELRDTRTLMEYERQKNSMIGRLGMFIHPVMEPLGFDWKMSVAILTGVAAKEIVVGTLGVLYQAAPNQEELQTASLIQKLQEQQYIEGPRTGELIITPLVALSFMVFILIYFPCVAVIATIRRESGSWKWASFVMVYSTAVAWATSFLLYQVGIHLL